MRGNKPKKGVALLIGNKEYLKETAVNVEGIWDIVIQEYTGRGSEDKETIKTLAENIFGSKDAVTRLAQEAFGFNNELTYSEKWDVVSSKVKVMSTNVEQLLSDLGIEAKSILEDPPQKEKKKK